MIYGNNTLISKLLHWVKKYQTQCDASYPIPFFNSKNNSNNKINPYGKIHKVFTPCVKGGWALSRICFKGHFHMMEMKCIFFILPLRWCSLPLTLSKEREEWSSMAYGSYQSITKSQLPAQEGTLHLLLILSGVLHVHRNFSSNKL